MITHFFRSTWLFQIEGLQKSPKSQNCHEEDQILEHQKLLNLTPRCCSGFLFDLSQPLLSNGISCHCEAPRRFFHALSRIFKVKEKLWDVPFDFLTMGLLIALTIFIYISSLWIVIGLVGAVLIKALENLVNDLSKLNSQPHPKNLNIKHVADSNWMSMMPSARLSWRFPLTTFESSRLGWRFCLSCSVRVHPQRAKGNKCMYYRWFFIYSTVI